MTHVQTTRHRTAQWLVCPAGLPLIRRRCLSCRSAHYRAHGKFRVNANHKLLDVWLLALCTGCGETIKLTVLERAHVRTIDPAALTRFHDNDPELAAKLLQDPMLQRRNRVTLDWDAAWTLRTTTLRTTTAGHPEADVTDTSVRFTEPIPIRRAKLLSAGLGMPTSEVRRLIAAGTLTSTCRLTGKSPSDFTFTLRRQPADQH